MPGKWVNEVSVVQIWMCPPNKQVIHIQYNVQNGDRIVTSKILQAFKSVLTATFKTKSITFWMLRLLIRSRGPINM